MDRVSSFRGGCAHIYGNAFLKDDVCIVGDARVCDF